MKRPLKMKDLTEGNDVLNKGKDIKLEYPIVRDEHIKNPFGFLKKK